MNDGINLGRFGNPTSDFIIKSLVKLRSIEELGITVPNEILDDLLALIENTMAIRADADQVNSLYEKIFRWCDKLATECKNTRGHTYDEIIEKIELHINNGNIDEDAIEKSLAQLKELKAWSIIITALDVYRFEKRINAMIEANNPFSKANAINNFKALCKRASKSGIEGLQGHSVQNAEQNVSPIKQPIDGETATYAISIGSALAILVSTVLIVVLNLTGIIKRSDMDDYFFFLINAIPAYVTLIGMIVVGIVNRSIKKKHPSFTNQMAIRYGSSRKLWWRDLPGYLMGYYKNIGKYIDETQELFNDCGVRITYIKYNFMCQIQIGIINIMLVQPKKYGWREEDE